MCIVQTSITYRSMSYCISYESNLIYNCELIHFLSSEFLLTVLVFMIRDSESDFLIKRKLVCFENVYLLICAIGVNVKLS